MGAHQQNLGSTRKEVQKELQAGILAPDSGVNGAAELMNRELKVFFYQEDGQ